MIEGMTYARASEIFKFAMSALTYRAGEHCLNNDKITWPNHKTHVFHEAVSAKAAEEVRELLDEISKLKKSDSAENRKRVYAEAADVVITIMSAMYSIDKDRPDALAEAIADKIAYNEVRADHKGPL